MAFSDYWFDTEFHELPTMLYFADTKELDLSHSCVNIVPAGLKGVEEICLHEKPIAVAPDFNGKITYEWGVCSFLSLTNDEVRQAKLTYKKHKKFCETPHTWAGSDPHTNYKNLPSNMRFITLDGLKFLDLRRCNVAVKRSDLYISVKAVLLPTDREGKATRLLKRINEQSRQRQ